MQRDVLRLLSAQRTGLTFHDIALRLSQSTGKPVYGGSIPGSFSHRRSWLDSDSGRLNATSLIVASEEGRAALAEYDGHREATHPMGPVVPDRFFVFVEEVQTIKRHTMVVRNVASAEEAEAVAREQCARGEYPQVMTISTERSFAVRPVRQGHGA
jgi:hypothetical protein